MAYVHRYTSGGQTFYTFGGSEKPSGSFDINPESWGGRAAGGNVGIAQKALGDLKFSKKEKGEETEKKEEEKKPEKTSSIHSLADYIRSIMKED